MKDRNVKEKHNMTESWLKLPNSQTPTKTRDQTETKKSSFTTSTCQESSKKVKKKKSNLRETQVISSTESACIQAKPRENVVLNQKARTISNNKKVVISSDSSSSSNVVQSIEEPTYFPKKGGVNKVAPRRESLDQIKPKHTIFHSDDDNCGMNHWVEEPSKNGLETRVDMTDLVRPQRSSNPGTIIDMGDFPLVPVFNRFEQEEMNENRTFSEFTETIRPSLRNESVVLRGTGYPSNSAVPRQKPRKSLISLPPVGSTLQFSVAEVDQNLIPVISNPYIGVVIQTDRQNQLIDFGLIADNDVADMMTVRLDSLVDARIL